MIKTQKMFNKEIRDWMKYYANQIKHNLEWIDGIEEHNIDNDELEYHYSMIMDSIYSLYDKLEKYKNEM